MLVLQYVEQEEKVHGTKWGGLFPISSFGSRHYRWCHDRKGMACAIGTPVRTIGCMRSRQRMCTRATLCWAHNKKGYVATEEFL